MKTDLTLQMRLRWAALNAGEQRALKWGAAILSPLLFFWLLWQPAHSGVERLQKSMPLMRAQSAQVQAQAIEVQTLRQGVRPALLEGAALHRLVVAGAEAAGWYAPVLVIDPVDKNEVRIHAEVIDFAHWLRFLRELERDHHIRVDSMTVTVALTPGLVGVNAVLGNGVQE